MSQATTERDDLDNIPQRPFPFHRKKSVIEPGNVELPSSPIHPKPSKDKGEPTISFWSLSFQDAETERAYWRSHQDMGIWNLRIAYFSGFFLEIISSFIFLQPVRDTNWKLLCLTISSISGFQFVAGILYTFSRSVSVKGAQVISFILILTSNCSLFCIYLFLVKDILQNSIQEDHHQLYSIFHPYGFLLMLIASTGVAVMARLRFSFSVAISALIFFGSLIIWSENDSPLMDNYTVLQISVIGAIASLSAFTIYSYFSEKKRRI